MPRAYQVLSIIIFAASFALVLQFLSRQLSSFLRVGREPIVVKPDDISQNELRSENSRTSVPSANSTNTGKRADHERASSADHFKRTIVAIGDLHGDYLHTSQMLQKAGVIDERDRWTGNVQFLVQTGDVMDRGDDTIKLFDLMENLRLQAQEKGGQVLSILGNHEMMNLLARDVGWGAVSPAEIATFGSDAAREERLRRGDIGERWAAHYTMTVRLPLHPSLGDPNADHNPYHISHLSHAALSFVHGGLFRGSSNLLPYPSRINDIGRSALAKARSGTVQRYTPAEAELLDQKYGPLWYPGWAILTEDASLCSAADDILWMTGTRRMIMGHTTQLQNKGILVKCDGKIIVIDTGLSKVYREHGGVPSALFIEYTLTRAPKRTVDPKEQVWTEREVVKAIYMNGVTIIDDRTRPVTGDFA